jgi:hypothetical protein
VELEGESLVNRLSEYARLWPTPLNSIPIFIGVSVPQCFDHTYHGVHCVVISDFLIRGAVRRHFSRQVAQLFRRKF